MEYSIWPDAAQTSIVAASRKSLATPFLLDAGKSTNWITM
jgi:hypothetical protein